MLGSITGMLGLALICVLAFASWIYATWGQGSWLSHRGPRAPRNCPHCHAHIPRTRLGTIKADRYPTSDGRPVENLFACPTCGKAILDPP